MDAFSLVGVHSITEATGAGGAAHTSYMAGGTDLMQLWKNNVQGADQVVDIEALPLHEVSVGPAGLRLGALATMAEVAAHPEVIRGWPAISQALLLSASPQVRNMGTMGGNLLQRTRCNYFRDVGFACNKRIPGSGCPAIPGQNRMLGIVGTSEHCIATHPSDLPVALRAMDASVEVAAPDGSSRTITLGDFYTLPGDTPNVETVLHPGELITAILVPAGPAMQRSTYVKVRDRASFEFSLVSAAVGLHVAGGVVQEARVALGGVAPAPWRAPQVEAKLRGKRAEDATFREAALLASEGARPASQNGFKIKLMQRTVYRALVAMAA